MTELKTLKDLEGCIGSAEYFHHKDKEPTKDYDEVAIVKELREEAIKWLKKIDHPIEDREVKDKLKLVTIEADNCLYGARRFIIEFFNITDEDLK